MELVDVRIKLTEHDGKLEELDRRAGILEDRDELMTELRIELGKLQMQIKITWVLLMLVISGLVSVAFAVLKGGIP